MATTKHEKQCIFLFPWLGHGHISPFFQLGKKLSTRNFHVYFCSTPTNLKSIKQAVSINVNPHFSSIEFIDFNLPESSELPPHFHTTKGLPPNLMSPLKTAFDLAQPELSRILKTLKPNLLIYDFMQPWAPETAKELNIKAVLFLTGGAGMTAFLTNYCQDSTWAFPFPEFQFPEEMMRFLDEVSNGVSSKYRYMTCLERSSSIVLIKTSRTVEGKYMDLVSCITRKEMVPVGPLVQEPAHSDQINDDDMMIMDWLGNKSPNSVVFVSLGTEYFPSKEELEEIAYGLELSQVDFIWVLMRFHGKDADDALPEGFQKRVEGRGLIVGKWAPQAKILDHVSVGGFVSHCGWSSAIEGMSFGVPIIAIPMQLDQPFNARAVVGVHVGKEVVRDLDGKFKRNEIAKTIREVVVEEKGEELRRTAKEMRKRIKEKGDGEMNVVIHKLLNLIKAAG